MIFAKKRKNHAKTAYLSYFSTGFHPVLLIYLAPLELSAE